MSTGFEEENLPAPERRSFLGVLSALIAAGVGAVLAATIGRYAIKPAFQARAEGAAWSELGALEEFDEGKLVRKNVIVAQDAGWGKFQSQRPVWVVKKGEEIKVFSGVCPHLGCTVNGRADKFICACHNSEWNVEGTTLAGPSPRPLDALEHKAEDGKLKVRYQDFKQGITEKEALG